MQFFITGCSTGLGLELARAVLDAGHQVIASSRDPSKTPDLVTEIEKRGGHWITLDVSHADVDAKIQEAISKFGPIDVLINNAGYADGGVFETVSIDAAHAIMEANLFGPMRTIQSILPSMRPRKSGAIVNISSAILWSAHAGTGIYAASKWALEGLTESLVSELASFNIRVLSAIPGAMRTAFFDPTKVKPTETPAEYKNTMADFVIQHLQGSFGHEGVDPVKTAQAIIAEVLTPTLSPSTKQPVYRMPLGQESLSGMKTRAAQFQETAEVLEKVALGADFPKAE